MKNKKSKEELLRYYMGLPYTVKITPEEASGYFVEMEELEGCMSQGETIEEVMENIKDAQEAWLEVAIDEELKIPLPKEMEEYSGKFVLRVPKFLHRRLTNLAEKEGVSLNQMILSLLSERFAIRRIEKKIQELNWVIERLHKGMYAIKGMVLLHKERREIQRFEAFSQLGLGVAEKGESYKVVS